MEEHAIIYICIVRNRSKLSWYEKEYANIIHSGADSIHIRPE